MTIMNFKEHEELLRTIRNHVKSAIETGNGEYLREILCIIPVYYTIRFGYISGSFVNICNSRDKKQLEFLAREIMACDKHITGWEVIEI